MHFGLELGVVLSGLMRRHYQDHSRLVGRGQAWFCGMWEPHGYEVIKAPCEVVVMVIWPPLLAQLRFEEAPGLRWLAPFTARPTDRPQIDAAMKTRLIEQSEQLKKLIAPSSPADKARIRLGLLNILAMTADRCPDSKQDNVNLGPEHWSRLNHAVQLVFESRAFISTSRAAKESGLNRNIFSGLFEKWMGIRFADFALRYRLKLAADQLLSGNDPVKAVALNWGFTDTSHFHRVFQKHYELAPSEFRRKRGHIK
jgi:AraC-like DNA-binding protein